MAEREGKMVDWAYYKKFEPLNDKYLPARGEGDTQATQIATAVNKLVYKWYNDGDVYDNTAWMIGWANDLSSYANWLHHHTEAWDILERIWKIHTDDEYEELLKDLADELLDDEYLERMAKEPKDGTIYDENGPFEFNCKDEEW